MVGCIPRKGTSKGCFSFAPKIRTDSGIDGVVDTTPGVDRIIATILDKRSGKGQQLDGLIIERDQRWRDLQLTYRGVAVTDAVLGRVRLRQALRKLDRGLLPARIECLHVAGIVIKPGDGQTQPVVALELGCEIS